MFCTQRLERGVLGCNTHPKSQFWRHFENPKPLPCYHATMCGGGGGGGLLARYHATMLPCVVVVYSPASMLSCYHV